jgi:ribosome-associated protein
LTKKNSTNKPTDPRRGPAREQGERPAGGATKARKAAPGGAKRPRIHASHAPAPRHEAPAGAKPRAGAGEKPRRPRAPALKGERPTVKKAPLGAPRRTGPRRSVAPTSPEATNAARELALQLATAGMDKKAIGIEILDVCGKVDYADFLVIMTGRSDRHVHAIATGIEDHMRRLKVAPISIEGLQAATWVLIDFSDVVVHVFQEDARSLYDIEGLWIDASRVPVPAESAATTSPTPAAP